MKRNFRINFITALTLASTFVLTPPTAVLAAEDNEVSFDEICSLLATSSEIDDFCIEENGIYVTGCVLVENGQARVLTEREYLQLNSEALVDVDASEGTSENEIKGQTMPYSISAEFEAKKSTDVWPSNKLRRVTDIFDTSGLIDLEVSKEYTFTRSITKSSEITFTKDLTEIIDLGVEGKFGFSTTASTSDSEREIARYEPSGKHKYMAVGFTPHLANVTGTLHIYANIMGTAEIGDYACTATYPVTTSKGRLDGVYTRLEGDSRSSFPGLS